ncbi:hypothetical protein Bhyg_02433 [Pseudolycoriella hygida]|uniref:Uncharacterized protein n=1 Tax=Pseudolycoriella hygida TaxID=35572 RepID=A0A9Q0S6I1_9DIPT|nr:hypothetical protein Bhyg_02433 [Pseudolycoriella hygida]
MEMECEVDLEGNSVKGV